MTKKQMQKLIRRVSLYPPYLGAGIKLKEFNDDFTKFVVQLKMYWFNRNIFGTHFGGSLYAMCDPFFVFIVLNFLGKEYVVWDKSAKIDFKKAENKTVTATFEISKTILQQIKTEVDKVGKKTFFFTTTITNIKNETIATVEKEIYVRKKDFSFE